MQPIRILFETNYGSQTFGPIKTMRDLEIACKIDLAKAISETDATVKCVSIYEGVKELISISINCHVSVDYLLQIGKAIYLTSSNEEKF